MDKDELDLLQDVTPRFVSETRIIDGQKFEVPRMIGECGALFIGPDDGEVQCSVTGTRWLVGQQGGLRVKRRLGEIIRAERHEGAFVLPDTKNGQPRIVPMHPRVRCCAHIKQVEASATSRHFRDARAAVGMDWLHFHDLRHSAASAMINAGVDLYTVGGVLGHKSAISTKRYSHLITETMRAAIGRIGGQKLTHQGPVGQGKKTA